MSTTASVPSRRFAHQLQDYLVLGKVRLSSLVVFSAAMGYGVGAEKWDWRELLALLVGGTLVTLGANAGNQLLEIPYDARMRRTRNRPLPMGRLTPVAALAFTVFTTLGGSTLLWLGTNGLTALLALLSTGLYIGVYTPLKRISPLAVVVGAIPGGLPPLIGWAAATQAVDTTGGALFALQFAWQLPHFWAIAWLAYDDYAGAGYRLMPARGGANRANAAWTFAVSLLVIPAGILPNLAGIAGAGVTVALVALGVAFSLPAANHWQHPSRQNALEVMFASFFYLPLAQILLFLDRFF